MNTKGIKFLAVLAVMVMAFAAVIVLAPADNDVVAINVYDMEKDPSVITKDDTTSEYYISDDATVKITGINTGINTGITFYVQNGKELELNITSNAVLNGKNITIYSVTADQQAPTTSTVDGGTADPTYVGKIILDATKAKFNAVLGQTFVYKSLMPESVWTHTTSGKTIATDVTTGKSSYATISTDAVLTGVEFGSKVAIAAGQYIGVNGDDPGYTGYGVFVKDSNTGAEAKYTYYAVGANAGTVELKSNNDIVKIKNGSANVKVGTSTVSATTVKEKSSPATPVTIEYGAANQINVTGAMSAGTLTASGSVKFGATTSAPFVIDGATVIIANGTTIVSGSAIQDDGNLVLRNEDATALTITNTAFKGTVIAQNMKLWTGSDASRGIKAGVSAFTGLIDTSKINDNLNVDGKFASTTIGVDQTNTVVSDTTVTTSLTVNGTLIVNSDVTLIIDKKDNVGATMTVAGPYAQVINYGTIIIRTTQATAQASTDIGLHVHGGMFTNYGSLIANSDQNVDHATLDIDFTTEASKGLGFFNYGDVSVQRNDYVNIAANSFINEGSVLMGGNLAGVTVKKNTGDFVLSNAKVNGDVSVTLAKGGLFSITTIELKKTATITVSHLTTAGKGAQLEITPVTTGTGITDDKYTVIRGVNLLDTSTGTTADKIKFDLSGSIGMVKPAGVTGDNAKATFKMVGNYTITDVANISNGFTVAFDSTETTTLKVSGEFNISNEVTPATNNEKLNMYVTGLVSCLASDKFPNCNYVAAKYQLSSGTVIYSSFETAVVGASLADVNAISVGNIGTDYVTVTDDVTVPTGMNVSGNNIVIADGATIAVEKNAGFYISNIVVKKGMLTAENAYDLDTTAVHADVAEIDADTRSAAFMSLDVAIALTSLLGGGVIELSQDFDMTSEDLVIPENVIVDATAIANTEFVLIDSNLVVNGTLIVDVFKFIATTDDTKSITVNGLILDKHSNGDCFDRKWYTPVGVSYHLTVPDEYGGETVWFALTSIDNLQAAINAADDAKVTVEGDAKLGDLTITGRDDMPAEVTFNGDISAGTITIDDVTIIAKQNNKINATFANSLGSITIYGAYVQSRTMSIYSLDDGVVTMTGNLTDSTKGTYTIIFNGLTAMEDATIGWANFTGTDAEAPTILFNGVTEATGKKDLIRNYNDAATPKANVVIAGELLADNGTKLTITNTSTVEVMGILAAAEKTTTGSPGTVEVLADKIFVGMMKSDIYATGDSAALSGKFVLSTNVLIFVAPGSTIDEKIVEDLDTITIYIEDEEWFSVYAYSETTFGLNNLVLPIVNADVKSVVDEAGDTINVTVNQKVITQNEADKRLSQYGNIYINLKYDIFEVKIKTDGSVKAVYIDGILMETGESKNIFILKKQIAGTHKVTVEPAAGYTADGCVLYTEMGTILPGMAFTFTEYDCEFVVTEDYTGYVVTYDIKGTAVEPEPVPPTPEEESQWTVTTILLVILVVLIAIMAVIVALRLNRS